MGNASDVMYVGKYLASMLDRAHMVTAAFPWLVHRYGVCTYIGRMCTHMPMERGRLRCALVRTRPGPIRPTEGGWMEIHIRMKRKEPDVFFFHFTPTVNSGHIPTPFSRFLVCRLVEGLASARN